MSSKDKIDIEVLRNAINLLLDHLRDGGIREIELKKDYYWELEPESLYDVASDPSGLAIGSLFDDLESIQKLMTTRSDSVILLLLKVAPLLRYVGHTVTEIELINPTDTENG